MDIRTRTAALAATTLAAILLLGFAASAGADSPGLDQYVETLPNAGGNPDATGNDNNKNGGDNGGDENGTGDSSGTPTATGPAIDSSQLDALRSQGDAGRRAADALEATSGSDSGNGGSKADPTKAGHSKVEPLDPSEADGKAPVEAILSSMFGGGTGIVLPIIMLAVLVGGLVIAARTRAGSIDD
jgi:hypothetical protein